MTKLNIYHIMPNGEKIFLQSYKSENIDELNNDFLIKAGKVVTGTKGTTMFQDKFIVEYAKGKKRGSIIGEIEEA